MAEPRSIVFGRGGDAAEAVVFGWSPPEDGYTWTVGRRSVLCAALPHAPHGFGLEFTWSAFLPPEGPAAQRVAIRVGGAMVAEHAVRGLETVTFDCAAPQSHERRLLIEFDLPDAAQPGVVGGRPDERMLALCLRRIRILPHAARPAPSSRAGGLRILAEGGALVGAHRRGWAAPLHPRHAAHATAAGLDIGFGREGNAREFIREGWSAPEPGLVWTSGRRARMVLPRPAGGAERWVLEAEIKPFVQGERLPSQRLGVSVNGMAAGVVRVRDLAVVRLEAPWGRLAEDAAVELAFDLPDAARPRDLKDGSSDDRELGFSFHRLLFNPASPASPARPAPSWAGTPAAELPPDRLMLGFESLGENCEFGLVQRACGVEPLGLLRFASAPLDKLLAALHARFDGLGQPNNLTVELSANGREYMVLDRAFGFYYHAWVLAGEKTPEEAGSEIVAREVRRLPFLARKLAEDLESAEKIFVYHGMRPLSADDARALLRAVRLYGLATLLLVELAHAGHAAGSVERAEDGLLRGYIDRFAPGEDAHDFSMDSWVTLCRAAAALQEGGS
jgi:hypothetical protein